jgi:hypothetical protein
VTRWVYFVENNPINYNDPTGHTSEDGGYYDRFGNYCGAIPGHCRPDLVDLSPEAQDLIDFSKIVGKTPEQVIAIGIGHEMYSWNENQLVFAKEHFANRFVDWARSNCGGNLSSYNCMLNFFMKQYESVQNMVYENSNYGRANRVHNIYWNKPEKFDLDQRVYWNNLDRTTSINM